MIKGIKYIVFLGLACILCVPALTFAADKNDDILSRKMRLPKSSGTIYQLLMLVSNELDSQFIYDSEVIRNDQQAHLPRGKYTLREAVHQITGNKNINIRIVGNHILLFVPQSEIPEPSPDTLAKVTRADSSNYFVIEGSLQDRSTNEPIPYVSVSVGNGAVGTISNLDGYFMLKLHDSLINENIRFTHIGYYSQETEASVLTGKYVMLPLSPHIVSLKEAVIRVVNPIETVRKMVQQRAENYATHPAYFTSFYREGVNFKGDNISLTESVLQIYKTGYLSDINTEQVKLLKMRRITNNEKPDIIVTKLKSGINSSLSLDLVKTMFYFLDIQNESALYNYNHTGTTMIDGRSVNVISFEQKNHVEDALYKGRLYIDAENYALVQAEFELHPKYIQKATNLLVTKTTRHLRLTPQKVIYTVSYKPLNGTYYINHIRGDLFFKARFRKRLSSPEIHTWLEMVTCEVETGSNVTRFPREERLPTRAIFSDTNFTYDNTFWGNFNIIMPEEKLRESVLLNLSKESEVVLDSYEKE